MKQKNNTSKKVGFVALALVTLLSSSFSYTEPTQAAVDDIDMVPAQSDCDNGSTTYTWEDLGLDRPVIASMSVDGETIDDPTNPPDGSIGAVICPNVDLARKTGLTVFHRVGSEHHSDLTGAVTPDSETEITEDSEITLTLTNMGELAEFYSFSLVHGVVTNWETADLGTADASLSVTLKPATTPYGSGEDFNFCTATPPHCDAVQSDFDGLSASLDMDFDQEGNFADFTGAYFGLVGAMGGFVQASGAAGSSSLIATLGAPHFLADGTTPNVGSMQAFLPDSVVSTLFGLTAEDIDDSTLEVTRDADEESGAASFTVSPVVGGLLVEVPDITFSSPVYTIQEAAATTDTTDEESTPTLPDTGIGPR